MPSRNVTNLIIGAGPYGLSLAAHLRARGISYLILGRPMDSWRAHMPRDMMLRSEPFASCLWDPQRNLTIESYCREKNLPYRVSGRPITLTQFLDYSSWFQSRAVSEVEDETVVGLDHQETGFTAKLASSRTISATNVIVATGLCSFRFIPPVLETLPQHFFSHTSDHRDFSRFRNRRVAIVGIGQSALETAALLREQGAHACVLGRRANVTWNSKPAEVRSLARKIRTPESGLAEGWVSLAYSELPQAFRLLSPERRQRTLRGTYGPSGAWWLRDRVDGKLPVLTSREIAEAELRDGAVALTVRTGNHSDRIVTDHVIAGTGFRVDIARLPFLGPSLLSKTNTYSGYPRLNREFESTVPGLFFVGAPSAFEFGPVMRFMFGAKHAAPILARTLARRMP